MTTYRVGAAGATVFDLEGRVVCRLRPGTVVVEGSIPLSTTPPDEPIAARIHDGKRVRGYADKMIRVTEDKHDG